MAKLEQINLIDVAARRQVAFELGYKEPSFWDSFEGETKSRRVITRQDLYKYGSASPDHTFIEKEKKLSQDTFYTYKGILDSGQEMSETFKQTLTECMEKNRSAESDL